MKSSSLYSEDLAPIPASKRSWNTWNYAALWICMSLCKALVAILLGILPNVPGFTIQVELVSPHAFWPGVSEIYNYAWFAGFIISGLVYYTLMKNTASEKLKKGKQFVSSNKKWPNNNCV